MLFLPLPTRLLRSGDDLAAVLAERAALQPGDILVVSSKAVATLEGAAIDLSRMTPSQEAERWSAACGRSPAFCQAVIEEVQRRNGAIVGTCSGALLTELRPAGLTEGTIFAANAGLDQSNIAKGWAVGWPGDPVASVRRIRESFEQLLVTGYRLLEKQKQKKRATSNQQPATRNNRRMAVIVSDSCCIPRRRGVIAYALAVSGIDPLVSEIGNTDLFDNPLRITVEARADQLATAANILMGNAGQGIPAILIRNHGIPLSDYEGWVPGIEPENDLFRCLLHRPRRTSATNRSVESA